MKPYPDNKPHPRTDDVIVSRVPRQKPAPSSAPVATLPSTPTVPNVAHGVDRVPRRPEARNIDQIERFTSRHNVGSPIDVGVPRRRAERRRFVFVVLALTVVLIAIYIGLNRFGSMTVVITPKESAFTLSRPVTITLEHETLALKETSEIAREATTKTVLNRKSTGDVLVFNAFGTASQMLVAGTRFQSPSGNIYRIVSRIEIPPAVVEGGTVVPSSIRTKIVADDAGPEFDITEGTEFRIPGFQGSQKYEKFYARAVTPIMGGKQGEVRVVGESEANDAMAEAERQLVAKLDAVARQTPPKGFEVLKGVGGVRVTSREVSPAIGEPADKFTAIVRGEAVTTMVRSQDLARALTKLLFENFPEEKNSIQLTHASSLSAQGNDTDQATIQVTLDGTVDVVWVPDITRLRKELYEANTDAVSGIFRAYESIAAAEVSFTPSWWRRVPGNESRIYVNVRNGR